MNRIPGWVQEAFLAPNVSEITMTVGIINEPEHCQWQLEMRNPVDGTLLDLQSKPHFLGTHLPVFLLEGVWLMEEMIVRNYGTASTIGRACNLRERLRSLGVSPPHTAEPFP